MATLYGIVTRSDGYATSVRKAVREKKDAAARQFSNQVYDAISAQGLRDTVAGWKAYRTGNAIAADIMAGNVLGATLRIGCETVSLEVA